MYMMIMTSIKDYLKGTWKNRTSKKKSQKMERILI